MFFDEGAVAHAFSVASGLDSLVIGESQILGQVKRARPLASLTKLWAGPQLLVPAGDPSGQAGPQRDRDRLGRSFAGERGYRLLTDQLGGLDGRRVLVVGAGAMAGLAARTAAADGASVTCANRTLSRAERLAEAVGGKAVELSDLAQALAETDVLVTCTGAGPDHWRRGSGGYAGARSC